MKFVAARMSFVLIDQLNLFQQPVDKPYVVLAEVALQRRTHYSSRRSNGVGFVLGSFITGPDGALVAAKLGILRGVVLTKFDEETQQFVDVEDESYQKLQLLWDREQQVILLERNTSVYHEPEKLFEHLQTLLNYELAQYGLQVIVRVLPEPSSFWKTVERYDHLYTIRFRLAVPNLFGHTQKDLADWLKGFREDTNATEVVTEVSNPEGKLVVKRDDVQVNEAVSWVEKGAGEWTVTGATQRAGKRSKRKKTSSSKTTKQLDARDVNEEITATDAANIVKELRPGYGVAIERKSGGEE